MNNYMQTISSIKKHLMSERYKIQDIDVFCGYLKNLFEDDKSKWSHNKDVTFFTSAFKKVVKEGLKFDGKHITLQSIGVSYDYVAYKNKMLLVYPETVFNFSEVYEGDDFSFEQSNGKVFYNHKITKPFDRKPDNIIGLYCVIKNKRGEFLTLLSREEIAKHRKVAKTDFIWKSWELEMMLKTVIKKAVKVHFDDIYNEINEEDNKFIDIEKPVDIELTLKQDLEKIKTTEELAIFQQNSKAKYNSKMLNKAVSKRFEELENENS